MLCYEGFKIALHCCLSAATKWCVCVLMGTCVDVLQQENRANSPTPIMHGRQVNIPLSVHHPPPNQLPLVSPPTQEDLWHLPGRLRESLLCTYHSIKYMQQSTKAHIFPVTVFF